MTAEEIAETFDISLDAAIHRFRELEKLARMQTGAKRPLPASIVQYLSDARKKGFKVQSLD